MCGSWGAFQRIFQSDFTYPAETFGRKYGGRQQHQDYFDVFFQKGGSYINFANMIGENLSVVKMGKQYRISAVVSVAKDALYQELVSAGVIKGLNMDFSLCIRD